MEYLEISQSKAMATSVRVTVTILERVKHLLKGWRKANRKQGILGQVNSPVSTGPQTSDSQNTIDR